MTTQFHEGLAVREFKDAMLSISNFRAWLTKIGREVEMAPALGDKGFIQVEFLLCAIERAAQHEFTPEQARTIVAKRPSLADQAVAALPPSLAVDLRPALDPAWLIGAEAHRAWREEVSKAIERGELVLLCPVTKLPIASIQPSTSSDNAPKAPASQASAKATRLDATPSKRERQIQAIEATADAMSLPRLEVPTGGKAGIKKACKEHYSDLFGVGDDPFNDAWKEASKAGRVRMKDRKKFAGG